MRERDELRFNKGEKGCGRSYFGEEHIARLTRMLSHYPVTRDIRDELLAV